MMPSYSLCFLPVRAVGYVTKWLNMFAEFFTHIVVFLKTRDAKPLQS